ncbi:aspartate aminotransferase family protein [Frigidibacter sp. MR17.24]|uniref:aspartate aminotransferase family protein n=1 Tax=Frigidibacter sp. MR17.24 TaxID=3127345 RepID=UPI003012C880
MNIHQPQHLPVDWDTDRIISRRDQYFAATQRAFVPFAEPLIIKKGRGQYVWDEKGNKLIDLMGMNLCISVGHAHPMVVEAVRAQAGELMHCTTVFHHPVPVQFAEELAATMPAGEEWVVHFTNSGTEAIDLAMMMARTYTGNSDLIALRNSYHGATFGAQSITGTRSFRHDVGLLNNITFAAEPNQYRGTYGPGTDPYVADMQSVIDYTTSGRIAGALIETVQGYGGIIPMPEGYLSRVARMVRKAGGLLILDEVQSGFCKTGQGMWGFEAHDVVPDIVVMAKGIGNGIPLAAVVVRKEIAEAMAGKYVFHTYGSNPIACAAGRAVLQVIREENLLENVRVVGDALREKLLWLQSRHEVIGDVRGMGFMQAMELVKDRDTKEPAPEETARVFARTREQGLIMSKSGNFGNIIRMVPPLCLSMDDVEEIGARLDRAFSAGAARA